MENIYMKCLEIGQEHQYVDGGISYYEMLEALELSFDTTDNKLPEIKRIRAKERPFINWFFQNFSNDIIMSHFTQTQKSQLADGTALPVTSFRKDYRNDAQKDEGNSAYIADEISVASTKSYINGSGMKIYLEWIELKEARQNASSANTKSLIAIILTCAGLIASVWFSIENGNETNRLIKHTKQNTIQLEELKQEVTDVESSLVKGVDIVQEMLKDS